MDYVEDTLLESWIRYRVFGTDETDLSDFDRVVEIWTNKVGDVVSFVYRRGDERTKPNGYQLVLSEWLGDLDDFSEEEKCI